MSCGKLHSFLGLSTGSWLGSLLSPCDAAVTRSHLVIRQQYYTGVRPSGQGLKRNPSFLIGKWCVILLHSYQHSKYCQASCFQPVVQRAVLLASLQGCSPWSSGPSSQILLNPAESIFNIFHVCYLTHMTKHHTCLKCISQRLIGEVTVKPIRKSRGWDDMWVKHHRKINLTSQEGLCSKEVEVKTLFFGNKDVIATNTSLQKSVFCNTSK